MEIKFCTSLSLASVSECHHHDTLENHTHEEKINANQLSVSGIVIISPGALEVIWICYYTTVLMPLAIIWVFSCGELITPFSSLQINWYAKRGVLAGLYGATGTRCNLG